MSNTLVSAVYRTRLGNPTAKSVLALLADRANDEGFCFPSSASIARDTELSLRQVQRILQIFENIGLLTRRETKTEQYDHYFIIHPAKLGSDHTEAFGAEHAKLQKQKPNVCQTQDEGVCQTPTDDSQTRASVSQTQTSVCQTLPPHPLIGVTTNEPPGEPSLEPARTESEFPLATIALTRGRPVNGDPDLGDLARKLVCAHPRALLRGWSAEEVPYTDLCYAIEAIDAEAKRAQIPKEQAAEAIIGFIGEIAKAVHRTEWKFLKPPGDFFRLREYRMEPSEFLRGGPAQSTQPAGERKSFAQQEHDREQAEVEAARARRREADSRRANNAGI